MEKKFQKISKKQAKILTWWTVPKLSNYYDALICDGAIRSGKTVFMFLSYVTWAMKTYDKQSFAICGKSIQSCRRNVTIPHIPILRGLGMRVRESITEKYLEIDFAGHQNRFYIFGGKDEGSADLIQGMTLAGIFFDEVVLQPKSFVEQGMGRCSVAGSKFWFNCNPNSPMHWFYTEWIEKREEKRALYLHFTMEDNPSLSEKMKARYRRLYSGVFYKRFILGQWVPAEGLIYPTYAAEPSAWRITPTASHMADARFISIGVDFGGNRSLTTFVAGAIHGNFKKITVLKDYHVKGIKGDIDANRICTEFITFLHTLRGLYPSLPIQYVFADSAEQYLINSLRRAVKGAGFPTTVTESRKEKIIDRIVAGNTLLNTHRIFFAEGCDLVGNGLASARWDEKKENTRLDDFTTDIDIVDAFEYMWEAFLPKLCPQIKRGG